MKRCLAMVCAAAILFALCGCGGRTPTETKEPNLPEATEVPAAENVTAPEAAVPEENTSNVPESLRNAAAHRQEPLYGAVSELSEAYVLAAELGNRYGIYFRIADLVPQRILADGSQPQNDPALVKAALLQIDAVLSAYPEDYFDQLVFGDYDRLEVYLTGFCPVGMGYAASGIEEDETLYLMLVLDAETEDLIRNFTYTIPHELAHLTDWRLQFVSDTEEGHLFSEDTWAAMNPEGFTYAYMDQDLELSMYDLYFPWFAYSYGCQNPTEDRATLFGYLMEWYYEKIGGTLESAAAEKLGFYLQCIRDGFDTSNWPEETTWEMQYRLASPIGLEG